MQHYLTHVWFYCAVSYIKARPSSGRCLLKRHLANVLSFRLRQFDWRCSRQAFEIQWGTCTRAMTSFRYNLWQLAVSCLMAVFNSRLSVCLSRQAMTSQFLRLAGFIQCTCQPLSPYVSSVCQVGIRSPEIILKILPADVSFSHMIVEKTIDICQHCFQVC